MTTTVNAPAPRQRDRRPSEIHLGVDLDMQSLTTTVGTTGDPGPSVPAIPDNFACPPWCVEDAPRHQDHISESAEFGVGLGGQVQVCASLDRRGANPWLLYIDRFALTRVQAQQLVELVNNLLQFEGTES